MAACAQCGWTQGHAPACALGQVTGPLQQINSGVGALVAGQAAGFSGVQNELALGNIAAFAQLGIQTQELAALDEINVLLQQQAAMQQRQTLEQRRQAALQQLLFETEMFVRKVGQVGQQDVFAAGVMSALRLEGLKAVGVGPLDFTAIEHKRAFQGAVDRLTAAWNGLTGADVEQGRSFVRTFLELVGLHRALDDLRNVATVTELEAEMARRVDHAGRDVKLAIGVLLAGPVSLVLGFGLAVHFFDAGNVVGSLAGFGLMVASPFVAIRSIGFLRSKLASRRRVRSQADAVAAYKAFVERADGGGLLAGVFEKHAALRP